MPKTSRVWSSSLSLLAANLSAGVLHYLFQVRAAARLEPAAYGALNGFMAYLSLALFAGGAAQTVANFFPGEAAVLRRISAIGIATTVVGLAWLGLRPGGPSQLELGVACALLGTLQQWLLGQFQARTWFGWMGGALVLTAVVKWGVALSPLGAGAQPELAYFWAFPLAYAAGLVWQSGVVLALTSRHEPTRSRAATLERHSSWAGAIVLALGMSLLPQLDMLCLRALQPDHALGLFARTALFSKALFFAALTLLQVALPYHLRAQRGELPRRQYTSVLRLERLGITACVIGSFAAALLGPAISERLLGWPISGEQRLWVLTSCLALTALYGHLRAIQLFCAMGQWRSAAARLAAVAALYPLAVSLGRGASIGTYLAAALGYYLGIELTLRAAAAVRGMTAARYEPQPAAPGRANPPV